MTILVGLNGMIAGYLPIPFDWFDIQIYIKENKCVKSCQRPGWELTGLSAEPDMMLGESGISAQSSRPIIDPLLMGAISV